MQFTRRVRENFDYEEFLQLNCNVKRASNGELRINCPLCGDNKFKCYVNNDKKLFNCYKCDFKTGSRYDVFHFVAAVLGTDKTSATMHIINNMQSYAPSWSQLEDSFDEEELPSVVPSIRTIESLPEGSKLLDDPEDDEQLLFWEYLLSRGFTEQEIRSTRVHYITQGRHVIDMSNRIVFPVYGGDHKLVSWVSRALDLKAEPRYFNCPLTDLKKTFWPYVPPLSSNVVVVEGIFDALTLRRLGYKSYATFGKAITEEQQKLLLDWGVKDILLFWDQKDAKPQMLKAAEDLKIKFSVSVPDFSKWPDEKDATDMLQLEDGMLRLKSAVENKIDVNSMEFILWRM